MCEMHAGHLPNQRQSLRVPPVPFPFELSHSGINQVHTEGFKRRAIARHKTYAARIRSHPNQCPQKESSPARFPNASEPFMNFNRLQSPRPAGSQVAAIRGGWVVDSSSWSSHSPVANVGNTLLPKNSELLDPQAARFVDRHPVPSLLRRRIQLRGLPRAIAIILAGGYQKKHHRQGTKQNRAERSLRRAGSVRSSHSSRARKLRYKRARKKAVSPHNQVRCLPIVPKHKLERPRVTHRVDTSVKSGKIQDNTKTGKDVVRCEESLPSIVSPHEKIKKKHALLKRPAQPKCTFQHTLEMPLSRHRASCVLMKRCCKLGRLELIAVIRPT